MELNRRFICYCFLLGLAFDIPVTSAESAWQNSVIQGYGKMYPMFDNPNLELIEALKRNGVIVYVCGQALAHGGFAPSWVHPKVTVALAALTVLPIYQLDGYAPIPE